MRKKYIEGTPRNQLVLFTETIDSIIDELDPVRFIDVYVDSLSLTDLGIEENESIKGRPKYHPLLFLKIYIYCYLNKIRSSRNIEIACKKNIDLIWLTQQLTPDHWSINEFRKKNGKVLKATVKEFMKFCYKLDLISLDLVAVDGTKMRADNSRLNVITRENIEKREERISMKIDEYLKEIDNNDSKEKDEFGFLADNIPKRIKNLEKVQKKLREARGEFENNTDLNKIFMTDPDSRFQKDNGRIIPGYNAQTLVDNKHKLIIATSVTNESNDLKQLIPMHQKLQKVKKDFKANKKTTLIADAGYFLETNIFTVSNDEHIDLYVADPKKIKRKEKQGKSKPNQVPSKGYKKEDFRYDENLDIFFCPENHPLEKVSQGSNKNSRIIIKHRCRMCKSCDKLHLCTNNKDGRYIDVSKNHYELVQFRKKISSSIGKKIVAKRKEIVEHPFGTIKWNWGFSYFMQRRLEQVDTEFNFMSFIYNLKRVIKIIGIKKLIEVVKANKNIKNGFIKLFFLKVFYKFISEVHFSHSLSANDHELSHDLANLLL